MLQTMIRRASIFLCMFLFAYIFAAAQQKPATFPSEIVISQHTFFDFGPPFDYYEVITVDRTRTGLSVERVLVTPAGDECIQQPTVEVQTGTLHGTMAELFENENPCEIPDNVLDAESSRCKNCMRLSGADVTLHVGCEKRDRQLRMDILDRDMFDRAPKTPQYTSLTMRIMTKLNQALGPGVMEKPAFAAITPNFHASSSNLRETMIVRELMKGKFDNFFDSKPLISELAHESKETKSPTSVEFIEFSPFNPTSVELPTYPPIAEMSHVQGDVTVRFDVSQEGKAENLAFVKGSKLLESTMATAIAKWRFPAVASGHEEQATINFQMNCGKRSESR